MQHRKLLCSSVRMEPAADQAKVVGGVCSPAPRQQSWKRSGSRAHSLQLGCKPGGCIWRGISPGCRVHLVTSTGKGRPSEGPPPEPQDRLTGGSGTLLCPTDRQEDICRQQKGFFFLLLNKVNYLFMHKTQVIVC